MTLAAALGAPCLLAMILLDGSPVPNDLESAATHPYWAVLALLPLIVGIWFLAGPAFAGRGDPSLDRAAAG